MGHEHKAAVFEDEGDTGYLYVYDTRDDNVVRYLHIYDRTSQTDTLPQDVQVAWSANEQKCGVVIWGKMRGIIDLNKNRPAACGWRTATALVSPTRSS